MDCPALRKTTPGWQHREQKYFGLLVCSYDGFGFIKNYLLEFFNHSCKVWTSNHPYTQGNGVLGETDSISWSRVIDKNNLFVLCSTTEEPQWNSAYTSGCLMGSTQMSLFWIDGHLVWLWLSRVNIYWNNSQVVLRYMQWKITSADCFQSWRQTCSKNQAKQFHLLLSPFMTWFWQAHQSLCCITHRLSSSVHGDYLLPSEGPVLLALYS